MLAVGGAILPICFGPRAEALTYVVINYTVEQVDHHWHIRTQCLIEQPKLPKISVGKTKKHSIQRTHVVRSSFAWATDNFLSPAYSVNGVEKKHSSLTISTNNLRQQSYYIRRS